MPLSKVLCFTKTSTTHDYVAESVVQIQKKPALIAHIEYSFYLSLFRPSEILWFGHDNGTTVLTYLLYSMTGTTHDYIAERVVKISKTQPILLT